MLQRIATGWDLDGLTPESYHLLPGEWLNEVISHAWTRCLTAWRGFDAAREELPAADRGTTLTRERWLLVLFQELGYGRLPFARWLPADLAGSNSATYPVSHHWEQTPLHLVSFPDDLDRWSSERSEVGRRSLHSLVQDLSEHSDGTVTSGSCRSSCLAATPATSRAMQAPGGPR